MRNSLVELNCYIIVLFIFIGLRDPSVGNDTGTYCRWYLDTLNYSFSALIEQKSNAMEAGYLVFSKSLAALLPYKQTLLIVQGAVVVYALKKFIWTFCRRDIFIPILIFMAFGLLFFHITGIRQSFSMSFCLLAYVAIALGKIKRSLIWYALALSFHTAAIIFSFAYILGFIWTKRNNLFTTICISLFIIASATSIQGYLSQTKEKWSMYSEIESTGNGIIFFIIILCITIFVELNKKRSLMAEHHLVRSNYTNLMLWSGRLISRTFERPALYFSPMLMPTLASGIYAVRTSRHRFLLYMVSVIVMSGLYIYRYHQYQYTLCF